MLAQAPTSISDDEYQRNNMELENLVDAMYDVVRNPFLSDKQVRSVLGYYPVVDAERARSPGEEFAPHSHSAVIASMGIPVLPKADTPEARAKAEQNARGVAGDAGKICEDLGLVKRETRTDRTMIEPTPEELAAGKPYFLTPQYSNASYVKPLHADITAAFRAAGQARAEMQPRAPRGKYAHKIPPSPDNGGPPVCRKLNHIGEEKNSPDLRLGPMPLQQPQYKAKRGRDQPASPVPNHDSILPTLLPEPTPVLSPAVAAALDHVAEGMSVFPCHRPVDGRGSCGKPACDKIGKHPRTKRGFLDATTDPDQVRGWKSDSNVAIATGSSNLVIVEYDGQHGAAAWQELERLDPTIRQTRIVRSGKGDHHYYWQSIGNRIGCSAGNLPDGIHVRGDGGYVMAAGSLHEYGTTYAITNDVPIAPLPESLRLLIQPEPVKLVPCAPRTKRFITTGRPLFEDHRNTSLIKVAGAMNHTCGMDEMELFETLLEVNANRCNPQLPDAELRQIAHSAAKYPRNPMRKRHSQPSEGIPVGPPPFSLVEVLAAKTGILSYQSD